MANRIIQFKRNRNLAANSAEAKQKIKSLQLEDGEIAIGSYTTPTNVDGNAKIIGVRHKGQVFSFDNQKILDVIGIDDEGNINALVTGSTILKSLSSLTSDVATLSGDAFVLEERVDTLEAEVEAISGGTSGDIAALSGKSVTQVEDTKSIDLTISNSTEGTKKVRGDVKLSNESGAYKANIIELKDDGLYAAVDYNSAENAIYINGEKKQLNGGSVINSIRYDSDSESLILEYSDATGGTHTITVSLSDLIEEYDFKAADTTHNVTLTATRGVSGATTVQADINLFDCGNYN